MAPWMSDADKAELLDLMKNRFRMGQIGKEEILRAEMALDTTEAQMRAALAEESASAATKVAADASVKNARYMLWSVIAATISAFASLGSTAIAVFGRH